MSYHLTESQFLERIQNTDFALKTQAQIAKDFERLGHESAEELRTTALSYETLVDTIAEMLMNVLQLGESQTLQLLYTIDIPQSQFLALTTDLHFVTKGAALVIRREAQKVHLRSIL